MTISYWLDVRDKPGLLLQVMHALAGDAKVSFEGDLSQCERLFHLPGATTDESGALRRNTIAPRQQFVVVPLERETVAPIFKEVAVGGRLSRDIIHVQIEKGGALLFGAYDNFHRNGCVVWESASEAALSELQAKGILRSYKRAPDQGTGD